jgi:hypothetical protein
MMGHYDDCYEHEAKERKIESDKQKESVLRDIENAINKLEYWGNDNLDAKRAFERLQEAAMWTKKL